MNIWAINKDMSIKHLLLLLESNFGLDSFGIDKETRIDDKAIYLYHRDEPTMKAYIFTNGQNENHYGVHLEFPRDYDPARLLECFEGVSYKRLCEMLSVHLDLTEDTTV